MSASLHIHPHPLQLKVEPRQLKALADTLELTTWWPSLEDRRALAGSLRQVALFAEFHPYARYAQECSMCGGAYDPDDARAVTTDIIQWCPACVMEGGLDLANSPTIWKQKYLATRETLRRAQALIRRDALLCAGYELCEVCGRAVRPNHRHLTTEGDYLCDPCRRSLQAVPQEPAVQEAAGA